MYIVRQNFVDINSKTCIDTNAIVMIAELTDKCSIYLHGDGVPLHMPGSLREVKEKLGIG